MVQSIDNILVRPVYNAVSINVRKPEVNKGENNSAVNDNGIYNAVKINVDNPTVNTIPQRQVYNYPDAKGFVTYEMSGFMPISVPERPVLNEEKVFDVPQKELEEAKIEEMTKEVPAPNYTTTEAEKGLYKPEEEVEKTANVQFNGVENKKIEIIPGEEIKPDVDVHLVVSNLSDKDYDMQAQQMEEITRISLDNPANAVPYIVREIFSSLIEIAKKDTSKLEAPTQEQTDARKKLIENFVAKENNPKLEKLPNEISDKEAALALKLSPMELAERNKEYAIYTMAVLAKVYTDEVQKHTGNVVPMTDIPGVSAIVDSLRYNPNAGVKIAALDALVYISRPEYKDEMSEIFSIAKADNNQMVSQAATACLDKINQK